MSNVISLSHQRTLNTQDYKTLSLASLGGALEFYDFIIFVFFSKVIGQLFFPADMPAWLSQLQTFGIFAAGYLIRPFGGIVMAHFGDLVGRKKMFTLSILLMALPTLFIGCLPTYQNIGVVAPILLLLMRLCQGLAVGGEVPGAWTFVAEHVPSHRVGIACGILTAGLSLGILLGSLVSTAINATVSAQALHEWGWRLPFILGGIFGLISMYLRRWLKETPIFIEMQQRRQKEVTQNQLPVAIVLSKHLPATAISMLLTWVLSGGIMVVILMTPIFLANQFSFTPLVALQANTLAIIGLITGCIFYGGLVDKFELSRVIIAGSLFAAIAIALFYFTLTSHPQLLFFTYTIAGFSVGVVGSFAFFMVNAFPTQVRYSGLSFSFNMAYAIAGGITPLLISFLADFATKLAPAYYVIGLFILGTLLGLYLNFNRHHYRVKNAE